MERLSGLDASFLYFETPNVHMHVVATIVFDPSTMDGGYSFDKIKRFIASRLHLTPVLRRRLATVPLNLHHPVWVDDERFDLDYHIRRVGCPMPGGEEELAEVVGDIGSRPLHRDRPLWEMTVVEGLANGNIAVVVKMHHCTIDGVSGANLMVHLFDLEPKPVESSVEEWEPERKPSDLEMLARGLVERTVRPAHTLAMIPKTIKAIASFITERRAHDGPGMAAPLTAPRTVFNTTVTPHRQVAFTRMGLDDVKAVKNAFGVTVNDVVLATCAGALRRYLDTHGGIPDRSLLATVPVSVRADEDRFKGTNKVSAMFATLATDIADPVERLRQIAKANEGAKREHRAIGATMLQDWAQFAAPTTFSLAARVYTSMRLAERHPVIHNLVISNVPGPRIPLYFAGARLVSLSPLGPIFDGSALNITVVSYMDDLNWGFVACRETVPNLWSMAGAVHDALSELRKAADDASA